jgi:dienelactone hydrolase
MIHLAHAHTVHVPIAGGGTIEGTLAIPAGARAVVVFAQGAGGTRYSLRNVAIARPLHERCLGTLLLDLLTPREEHEPPSSSQARRDAALLGRRLVEAAAFLAAERTTRGLSLGCYAVGVGGAAALLAAAMAPERFRAIVSRGGDLDAIAPMLGGVMAPTMLIVGEADAQVRPGNVQVYSRLQGPREMLVMDGATRAFEPMEVLQAIAKVTAAWFERFLGERVTETWMA